MRGENRDGEQFVANPVKLGKLTRAFLPVLIVATPLMAQSGGSFRIEETGRSFYRLDDAVKSLG